jgi:hypothetical protein
MTETTPQPDPQPQPEDGPPTQEWRPYGYTDARTGTTEAAGAQLRTGPATTPESGNVLAGDTAAPAAGESAESEVQLPDVLVPDTPETREAEQHPNLAAPPVVGGPEREPTAGAEAGDGGDLGATDGAGAEAEPEATTAGEDA